MAVVGAAAAAVVVVVAVVDVVAFLLRNVFAPQCYALFEHLNFQKRSEHGGFVRCQTQQRAFSGHLSFPKCCEPFVFVAFWLRNALRTTTACNFSSHLWKWLRARRVSEPTCQPCRATNQWKKRYVSRLFYLFTHLHLFFPLTFSLLRSSSFFSSLLFSSLLFSSYFSLSCRHMPHAQSVSNMCPT